MTRLQAQHMAMTSYRRPTYATSGFDLSDTSSQSDCTRPPEVDIEEVNAIARLYGAGRKPTTVALSFRRKSENSRPIRRHQSRLPKVKLPPSKLDATFIRNGETLVIPQINQSSQFKHGTGCISAAGQRSTVHATSGFTFRKDAKRVGIGVSSTKNVTGSIDCSSAVGVESVGSRCMRCQLKETVAVADAAGNQATGNLLDGNLGNSNVGGLQDSKSLIGVSVQQCVP